MADLKREAIDRQCAKYGVTLTDDERDTVGDQYDRLVEGVAHKLSQDTVADLSLQYVFGKKRLGIE